jgi:hypothetical protein
METRIMDMKRVEDLLARLDGSGSDTEWAAVMELRALGTEFPRLLRQRFQSSRSWKARSSCVYHAMRYAKESEDALVLGLAAIVDKAKGVRYRGAMLLAYAQKKAVLPQLRVALESLAGGPGADDLAAAIDAIENENHNYFVDRTHSGKLMLNIE